MTNSELIQKAIEARAHAYAPYSRHRVGAAVLCENGETYAGCNVENCVYPLARCAEQVAVSNAVSHGQTKFSKLAVVTGNQDLSMPCGACRQFLREFGEDMEVVVAGPDGKKWKSFQLKAILPLAFSPEAVQKGRDGRHS